VSRQRLDGLFVEAARRAHIVGRVDGCYGGFRQLSKEIVDPPGGRKYQIEGSFCH